MSHLSIRASFVWRVLLPIGLGVYLALWATQGDTSASDAQTFTATPRVEDSVSFVQGFVVVELRFPDASAVTVMGSEQLPLMRELVRRDGQRLDIDVRPRVLAKIER